MNTRFSKKQIASGSVTSFGTDHITKSVCFTVQDDETYDSFKVELSTDEFKRIVDYQKDTPL